MCIKEKIFVLLFALLLGAKAIAQEAAKVPTLDSILSTQLPDTTRAFTLSLLCYHLSATLPDSARIIGLEALALARKTGNEKTIANCESNLGWVEFRQGNMEAGQQLMLSASDKFRALGLTSDICKSLGNLAKLYMTASDFPKAFKCLEEELKLAEKSGDETSIAFAYNHLGRFYRLQGKFEEAGKYLYLALPLFEKQKNAALVADVLCTLGNISFEKEDYRDAIEFYKKALKTGGETANQYNVAAISQNTAKAFVRLKHFPEAFVWFEKTRQIFEKLGALKAQTALRNSIGGAYLEMCDLPSAKREFEYALKMASENHYTDIQLMILDNLRKVGVSAGDYKAAYMASQSIKALSDSLRQADSDRELQQLQTKFESAQKEKELAAKTLEAKRLQWYIAIGAAALLLLSLLAITLWVQTRQRRRNNEILIAKNLELEAARARAERSEAVKKQFLANMSHEIRTPLNALFGISNLLANRPVFDEKTTHYHHVLQKSSENLLVIVNDILDYSKLEAGKLQLNPAPFCLPELLIQTADMFLEKAVEKNIRLETDYSKDLPQWVFGDKHYLTQVLNNLLSNALKFTDKGSVQLQISQTSKESLRFSVSDTGIGIPQEKLGLIFESFEQVDAGASKQFGGTGLGLAIAQDIVRLMGGKLHVKSDTGSGSEFWFDIDLSPQATPKNQALLGNKTQTMQLHEPMRVLLAEDNTFNQIVATESLAVLSADFQVSVAANGREALALLENNDFDLLLLDVQMPILDGYELTRLLREHPMAHLRVLPIIALTASVVPNDVARCLNAGMNGYVPKPLQISELAREIMRILPEKSISFVVEKAVPIPANTTLADLSEFEKLTADLPGQRSRMLGLLVDGLAEKIAPLEAATNNGDQAAFANIVHAMRPLTLSAGMTKLQNDMTELEQNWAEMPMSDWEKLAKTLTKSVGQALNELNNAA